MGQPLDADFLRSLKILTGMPKRAHDAEGEVGVLLYRLNRIRDFVNETRPAENNVSDMMMAFDHPEGRIGQQVVYVLRTGSEVRDKVNAILDEGKR